MWFNLLYVLELSVIYFSVYPNFHLFEQKYFWFAQRVQISEDAVYKLYLYVAFVIARLKLILLAYSWYDVKPIVMLCRLLKQVTYGCV